MPLLTYTLWDANNWDTELVWDHATSSIEREIKRPHGRVFRRLYMKRRLATTGLFETDWVEITEDVKSWGSINSSIDFERQGKLAFSGLDIVVQNTEGLYNPEDNVNSYWYGYASQQRTLIKVECGFYFQWKGTDGRWVNEELPDDPTVFVGILSGNTSVSDQNEVVLPIQPLSQVFRDLPASYLTGFTSTGITASKFMEILRDQTDGAGSLVFRPFFNDTTTHWEITQTSVVYSNLNTSSAVDLAQIDCWTAIETLAQSENYIAYITPTGKFRWVPKTVGASATFQFFGVGISPNTEWGHTIKRIFRYGKKLTNFYSRVAVKFINADTNTSFAVTALAFAVSGSNTAWNLGLRTYSIENFWIPNTATAQSVAGAVFSDVSSLDEEINFSTSLIPHLNLLDRVLLNYDASDFSTIRGYWDFSAWDTELTWDEARGDAIILNNEPFKILSITINLDNLETRFVARQIN